MEWSGVQFEVEQVGLQWCGVAGVKLGDVGCSSAIQCGVEWSATVQCGVDCSAVWSGRGVNLGGNAVHQCQLCL
jgi:hypothetical protein